MGESVKGAGQYYTEPLLLQHRKHYSMEKFEISLMDAEIDVFLPFEWISSYLPQGTWTTDEVRFNSRRWLEDCTKFQTRQFPLTWDDSVALNAEARIIGYVAAATENEDTLKQVPMESDNTWGSWEKKRQISSQSTGCTTAKSSSRKEPRPPGAPFIPSQKWNFRCSGNG